MVVEGWDMKPWKGREGGKPRREGEREGGNEGGNERTREGGGLVCWDVEGGIDGGAQRNVVTYTYNQARGTTRGSRIGKDPVASGSSC